MLNGKTYYEILGVDAKAEDAVIKAAYRAITSKYHPDKNPGDKIAEEKTKEANIAYAALRDDRAGYDRLLAATYATNKPSVNQPPSTEVRESYSPPQKYTEPKTPQAQATAPQNEKPGFDRAEEKPGFERAQRNAAQRQANLNKKSGLGKYFVAAALGGAALWAYNEFFKNDIDVKPVPTPVPNTIQQAPQATAPQQPTGNGYVIQPGELSPQWKAIVCVPRIPQDRMGDNAYRVSEVLPQQEKIDAIIEGMKRDPNSELVKMAQRNNTHIRVTYTPAGYKAEPIIHNITNTFSLNCDKGFFRYPSAKEPQYSLEKFMTAPISKLKPIRY
ncbi:J domain-containing protein [Micavibrio aeruginosavorus]|uniref:DnaJ domain protein n=1 Tax=Micavibrio aeruginosavorus (strain ARL-13) TaxID=856793 RepID=G2KQM3_MICAA|nr:DnaJ domain-containing protein [Micavibrio aeruginosavorus]AEP09951.1 dnaJ domain protein [Micavibrio aeruginosavorus ARL-13]